MNKLYIAKVADSPNEWVVGGLVGENLIFQIEPCGFSKTCGNGLFRIKPETLLSIDEQDLSYLNELKDKIQAINYKKQESLNEILSQELEKVKEELGQVTKERDKAIKFIKYLDYNYSSYMTEDEKFSEWR